MAIPHTIDRRELQEAPANETCNSMILPQKRKELPFSLQPSTHTKAATRDPSRPLSSSSARTCFTASDYARLLRRTIPATPSRPVPSSVSVAGSGTKVIGSETRAPTLFPFSSTQRALMDASLSPSSQ